MIMKKMLVLVMATLSIFAVAANAGTGKTKTKKARTTTARTLGDAMRPKKSLEFDGRTIESLRGGKYDSYTHVSDTNGAQGSRKLYSLPRDFSNRVAAEGTEMRFRQ